MLQGNCKVARIPRELVTGDLPREVKMSSLCHMHVENKITITMWSKILQMKNQHKNWAQISETLETPIIRKQTAPLDLL